jgi:hypothetical protein
MKWIRTRIGPGSDLQTIPLPAFTKPPISCTAQEVLG